MQCWLKISFKITFSVHCSNFHVNFGMLWAQGRWVIFSPWAHLHTFFMMLSPNKGEKVRMSHSVSITVWSSCPCFISSILCTPSLPTTSCPGQIISWSSSLISNLVTFTMVFSFLRKILFLSLPVYIRCWYNMHHIMIPDLLWAGHGYNQLLLQLVDSLVPRPLPRFQCCTCNIENVGVAWGQAYVVEFFSEINDCHTRKLALYVCT